MGASQHRALALKCYINLVRLVALTHTHGADLHHRSAMLFSTAPRMKWLLSSYLVPALLTLPGLASAGTSLGEPFRVHSAQTT